MSPRPARADVVIGLEIHVQLATATKLFCGCPAAAGAAPNRHICPVCSGQPGALPALSRRAVELGLRLALGLGCAIARESRFARKSYFYPDLPRGYQITQHRQPLATGGQLELWHRGQLRRLPLRRLHLEDDAGKSRHPDDDPRVSLVDLNRAGVPLAEIVTEPCIDTPELAAAAMRALRGVVRALGVGHGNLEQGSLRCDANLSLAGGARVELKNLNSYRFVRRALEAELARQHELRARGEPVMRQTRLWDARRGVTRLLRTKEDSPDYRYFDEPDLPPLRIDDDLLARAGRALPELPAARQGRFVARLGLTPDQARVLTSEPELADYFEQTVAAGAAPARAAAWLQTELLARLDDARQAAHAPVSPAACAELLNLVASGKISGKLAKQLWPTMWTTGRGAAQLAREQDLFQDSDADALRPVVARVLGEHPDEVQQYRAGKVELLGYFVGRVMAATRGRANPRLVNQLLEEALR